MQVEVLENVSFMYNGTEVNVEKSKDSKVIFFDVSYDDGNVMFKFTVDPDDLDNPEIHDYVWPEGSSAQDIFWDVVNKVNKIVVE